MDTNTQRIKNKHPQKEDMKRSVIIIALVGLISAAAWLALRSAVPRHRPNVILISIDTCRPDYFGCYGREGGTTPHIDAFAGDGVRFANVVSPVPLTFPAHSSMLTGTIPPFHGVHDNIAYRLAERNQTLAELLQGLGYKTAGIVGAFVLDEQFGIAQGFDHYDDEFDSGTTFPGGYPERLGGDATQRAVDWLDGYDRQGDQPFFLFLHYFDPHHPYRPPEPFDEIFKDDLYAGEIAYTDHCIGKVLDKLKTLDLYESSVIIVTGDHGEAFGEHGEIEHGYYIYGTTTSVPLIMKMPGSPTGQTVSAKSSLVDIVPTILAQLGAVIPDHIQGYDLTALLAGEKSNLDQRYVYSESLTATKYGCSSLLGLENDQWKYIQTARPELYDLSVDPTQTKDMASAHPRQVGVLRERLRSMLADSMRAEDGGNRMAMDAQSLERLGQLGYTGGAVVEQFEFTTHQQDPKDFIDVYLRLEHLDFLVENKKYGQARKLCAEILAQGADLAYVHGKLGRMSIEQGRYDEAINHFHKALSLNADSALWHNNLGSLLVRRGEPAAAVEHFRTALRLGLAVEGDARSVDRTLAHQGLAESPVFQASMNLGSTLMRLDENAQALEYFRQAIDTRPDNPDGHFLLGLALRRLGRNQEAAESLRSAIRLDPDHAGAARALQGLNPPQSSP